MPRRVFCLLFSAALVGCATGQQTPELLRLQGSLASNHPGIAFHITRSSPEKLRIEADGPSLRAMGDTALLEIAVPLAYEAKARLSSSGQLEDVTLVFPPGPVNSHGLIVRNTSRTIQIQVSQP